MKICFLCVEVFLIVYITFVGSIFICFVSSIFIYNFPNNVYKIPNFTFLLMKATKNEFVNFYHLYTN